MKLQRAREQTTKFEYGCDLRRLYPWPATVRPNWGAAIASVRPGEATTPHAHDESETFLVLSGCGRMRVGTETEVLEQGDVVYIPKNVDHQFENSSSESPLVFLSIYWDSPEARTRLRGVLADGAEDV